MARVRVRDLFESVSGVSHGQSQGLVRVRGQFQSEEQLRSNDRGSGMEG